MNEGRAELQRVILQYEKQRAEAIRAKQEAEIVLPFMRAALEELDAALGQSENGEVMERVHSQVQSGKARASQLSAPAPAAAPVRPAPRQEVQRVHEPHPAPEPQRPAGLTLMNNVETFEEEQEEAEAPPQTAAKPAFGGFNRSSIASLLDDADKQAKAR